MADNLYQVENVDYAYQLGTQEVPVLKGVSVQIPYGSFSCLVGPSGTGKTTLLNLMGLLDRPQKGKLLFQGKDIGSLQEGELEKVRLYDLGFIFQAFYLIPTLSVLENTTYFLSTMGWNAKKARTRGEEVLEMVGLSDQKSKKPLELSGGQRQRVAIARALAKNPKVILADEPTANLDRKTAEDIIQIFKQLQKSGQTSFVFSTHDTHLVSYADRVLQMRDGKIEGGGK